MFVRIFSAVIFVSALSWAGQLPKPISPKPPILPVLPGLPGPNPRSTVPRFPDGTSYPESFYCASDFTAFQMGINYPLKGTQLDIKKAFYLAGLSWKEDRKQTSQKVSFQVSDCVFDPQNPVLFRCEAEADDLREVLDGKLDDDEIPMAYSIRLTVHQKNPDKVVLQKELQFPLGQCLMR